LIPFTALTNTPAGTNISYASGVVTIAATGFYQVTFGASLITGSFPIVALSVNGNWNAIFTQNVVQNRVEPIAYKGMTSMTVIIPITINPTTLALVNGDVATDTYNDIFSGDAPAAYMTITKLQ
jgi:hypothetical protein